MPWEASEAARHSDLPLRQKKRKKKCWVVEGGGSFFVVAKKQEVWEDILTLFLRNQVSENASETLQRRAEFYFCDFILQFHQFHQKRGVRA